ncbi:MAG: sugar transferase [Bacillota bacterium]
MRLHYYDGAINETKILKAVQPTFYDTVKRVLDLFLAVLVILLGSPLWILIAVLVKLTSPGPVLYRGTVVGKGEAPFIYYKFRTMQDNCNDSGHRRYIKNYICGQSRAGKYFKDDRITKVGRILRKTSMDEIPQLINVLKGEMSLVGPRPPVLYEYELYDDRHKYRLAVLPGITGLNQVEGRSASSFEEMYVRDIHYIMNKSLKLDLYILFRTVVVVFTGKGAY